MNQSAAPVAEGPSKGMGQISLLSNDERLQGRPRLCSDCGLCDSTLKPQMTQACMFVNNQTDAIEQRLFGRSRGDGDELLFGCYRATYAARMRAPRPGAQWSGMVTTLGARLLERGEVEAVITTAAAPGTRFKAQPILARTPEEVLATAGNKPSLSPNLGLLDLVREQGIKRLAFIGTGCQVHALRAIESELGLEALYVIGIPCSDNVSYPDLEYFLEQISRSPKTVVHHEFMQDFSLWLRHEDGAVERVNYIDFPMDKLHGIFPSACLSCFDYPNALSDLTIGYMGAELGWQWVMARTERGERMFEMLRPELEFGTLTEGGDRTRGMPRFMERLNHPPGTGRPPLLIRKLVAWLQRNRGPRGLEFARAVIEMKLLRNLNHVRSKFERQESRVVPGFVYRALAPYAEHYRELFDRDLAPRD
ncbi:MULTISPECIES: Coenzyme F420 hydrogenase/dehydrogenase, beta subunit C-terminal domain [unclassified Marichromatium]|uniref:Coenzyme F420 hydrogenase/dehydrogenase, beta subunit C-terminal domain n=1 Tax=unclassified Marichromatium TaxID=2618417 RepID=UPI000F3DCEF9|nr:MULTISPECIES: Coenzyme F420 hydrogenase/dehydrogenase, beta subunit C-terminal domain [unclassified Marichromatium]MBO8085129.1 Coenzyme F420 hydrogenase/dehydrogenase, beta subunit C-terminal domain [Marichromatium sp.]RNE88802.1 coenzyme F420 hydrogenase [Marichromatium sp. AB31]RNE89976.1 coenzyme F420 hydrogenase [Marichromatium sp. AB32]